MKTKNRKILSFICAIIILLSSTCTNLGIISSSVYASTEDISISEDELLNENEVVSNEETTINENEEDAEENILSKTDEIVDENTEEINEKEESKNDSIEINDEETINDSKYENTNETLIDEDLIINEDYGIIPLAEAGEVASVQYYGSISYGGSTVGNFAVNGKQAFCMAHSKKSPSNGMGITASVYNNDNIAKCLYYGWQGDGQWAGFTSGNMGIVMTSLALDYFYNGNNHKVATPFINFVNSQPLPTQEMAFSNSDLTGVKISDYEQATDTISLLGDSRYSISFTLQNGVSLHNITKGAIYTGTVTLNGGDSFFLTAPLDIKGSWTSENIGSTSYLLSTIVWLTGNSNYQPLGQYKFSVDPAHYINLSVNWDEEGEVVETPENPSSLEIKKVDETGTPLSGATFKIWNDGDYNKTARTDSKRNNRP